jgi:transposase
MAKSLLADDLWAAIAPQLPPDRPKPRGGRPRVSNRAALTGIVFVLRTGIPWELLPKELGCGSGMTCWRRVRDWQAAGVWERIRQTLLNRLGEHDRIDWSRASLDSASVPAKRGANSPDPTRRIAANRERSAMLWSTVRGFLSPSS